MDPLLQPAVYTVTFCVPHMRFRKHNGDLLTTKRALLFVVLGREQ